MFTVDLLSNSVKDWQITAPYPIKEIAEHTVFLAGGITGCPDWQREFLIHYGLVGRELGFASDAANTVKFYNPRRPEWDDTLNSDEVSKEQIKWEKEALDIATGVIFWFPKETLCPITLYELGASLYSRNVIAIGIHPEYKRKLDVVEQTKLVDPSIPIVSSIYDLAKETYSHLKDFKPA